ncbi:MAG: hypothetical protein ACOCNT_02700 [Bacteroidales bacterium]|nr:hypothetical protein [Bacteroidales bacterium]
MPGIYTFIQKPLLENVEQQKRLAASPYSRNDFDQSVQSAVQQSGQVFVSFDNHLVLDFCVNTHFSNANIVCLPRFAKDFCVNTHFSNAKPLFNDASRVRLRFLLDIFYFQRAISSVLLDIFFCPIR